MYRVVETPECPLYLGVETPRCPMYRGVETPRCPMYLGVFFVFLNLQAHAASFKATLIQKTVKFLHLLYKHSSDIFEKFS